MARKESERKVLVTIRSQRKPVALETWRYWEIVGELLFMGEERCTAIDAAKWCARAKPGDVHDLASGIRLEVREDA